MEAQSPDQDVRIIKTRRSLGQALVNLLEENSFQKITVNDICREALVSRSTFYVHFYDKYKLLRYCLDEIRKQLERENAQKGPKERLAGGLKLISSKSNIFRNIFAGDSNQELAIMFRTYFSELLLELLKMREKEGGKFPGPLPLMAAFYTSGISGVTLWWIEQGYPISLEEMAACQYRILEDIIPSDNPWAAP
ncbi:TetR/AcrR family transcriptional regulator [Breznakiella homolactica]|uniref:TetR/AcrR family transcriptional regulator C-terminal domain-containing protein n=1 Tax=Breznakiella homolactica TaxID=2798577 RepID=A0A7T7XR57_9SPIR|nr:TetR/AcrR family transcriptional regulator C-terminal domain-containing protein [Breznakiella homolactica]QQO10975.1 TetR/AcrR family transcriptional regulator C-terminal domain-containing protein [Breznakiella homolactica]